MTDAVRIAMWSGPRNISTAMMRAFESRGDTVVVDEPFYACYLKASGADHPYREKTLAAMSADWSEVRAELARPLPPGKSILFEKHIAYHYPASEPLDWLFTHRTFLLIRNPRAMVGSYAQMLDDIRPIVESYAVERRIYEHLTAAGRPCPIVDADDVLTDPPRMLAALCAALGISYTDRMLSWPAGPRPTDGPWAPHWYGAVAGSTGFGPPSAAPALSRELSALAAACELEYRFLHERRLAAPSASGD